MESACNRVLQILLDIGGNWVVLGGTKDTDGTVEYCGVLLGTAGYCWYWGILVGILGSWGVL